LSRPGDTSSLLVEPTEAAGRRGVVGVAALSDSVRGSGRGSRQWTATATAAATATASGAGAAISGSGSGSVRVAAVSGNDRIGPERPRLSLAVPEPVFASVDSNPAEAGAGRTFLRGVYDRIVTRVSNGGCAVTGPETPGLHEWIRSRDADLDGGRLRSLAAHLRSHGTSSPTGRLNREHAKSAKLTGEVPLVRSSRPWRLRGSILAAMTKLRLSSPMQSRVGG